MTTLAKWSATAMIAFSWLCITLLSAPGLVRSWSLLQAFDTASGEIVRVLPNDHNRATYRFAVGQRIYVGDQIASSYRQGDSVRVYYSPKDPSLSRLSHPRDALPEDLIGLPVFYVLSAAGAMILAAYGDRHRTRGQEHDL